MKEALENEVNKNKEKFKSMARNAGEYELIFKGQFEKYLLSGRWELSHVKVTLEDVAREITEPTGDESYGGVSGE